MLRPARLMLLCLPLLTAPVIAQEAAPAPAPQPAPAQAAPPAGQAVAPDEATAFALPPNANDLLTGLYATRAVAELCSITIDPATVEAMASDEARFIEQLGITQEVADNAFTEIRTAIEDRAPDCDPGSTDVAGVEEVLAAYAAQPEQGAAAAAQPDGTTTPAATTQAPAEAAPAPAEPAPAE